jgi:hypothetical protein
MTTRIVEVFNAGPVVEVRARGVQGPGGAGSDGDKGDITVSGGVWTIENDVVTDAKLRDSVALSVIGRAGGTDGDPADIVADANSKYFGRRADALGFFALQASDIPDLSATYGTVASVAAAAALAAAAGEAADAAQSDLDAHLLDPHPTAGEKAALAGTSGAPGSGNKYVTDADTSAAGSGSKVVRSTAGKLATTLYQDAVAALAALTPAADKMAYFTGAAAGALADLTASARTFLGLTAVLGDIVYASGAATWARLAGNTTTTRKFLRQTGDGANSAAPAWDALQSGDLPAATSTARGAVKALHAVAAAPTVTDDTSAGYEVGQYWLDTAGKAVYIATDVTAGAAVWQRVTGSDLQVFTSSGTWTKPAGCSRVVVIAIGGGGGGGSGRRGPAGATRCGGSGGAGGGWAYDAIAASLLGATETITIGAGGTGGTAPSSDNTNGAAGTAGGTSTFGSHVRATGGRGGNGGATAASIAGGAGVQGGSSGGNGTNGNGSTGEHGTSGAPGGGGGGGVTSGNNDAGGGNGGQSGWLSGGGAGSAGAAAGGAATGGTAVTANRPQAGGGGGGGGGNAGGGGGAGGNGGLYGAGGGGAGAGTNGATGGNGGNGADGIVLVWSD